MTLEKKTMIYNLLGKSQAMINGAQKDGAEKQAPLTFKKSQLSLKTAESMISTNLRNPMGYDVAVLNANKEAAHLLAVTAMINKNGKKLSESAAVEMVAQNEKITAMQSNLDTETANNSADQAALANKNKELARANSKNNIQKALEDARGQFSKEEAEAYQQGDNLVIRLKKVNFASGRSDLPSTALPLLAKVSDVAKSLNASHIRIEGHTDSVGTEASNKTISESRAGSVATYFKTNGFEGINIDSEGFGFQKPIATNKSKEGRAQNRRVDIVITPEVVSQ